MEQEKYKGLRQSRLQLFSRLKLKNMFPGEWESIYTGEGIEFVDTKSFEPRDDLRDLDPIRLVQSGEEEIIQRVVGRQMRVFVWADLSGSMLRFEEMFLSGKPEIRDVAAGLLVYSAFNAYSPVGLCAFDKEIRCFLPAKYGETFINGTAGMNYHEEGFIEQAAEQAVKEGIKVITVGVGEKEGAKIPIYNSDGQFTGNYAKLQRIDYISYLEDDSLKEIASKTGGEYFSEQNLGGLIDYIKENLAPVSTGETNKDVKVYQPVAQWFLLASLPVLIFVIIRCYLLH